MLNLIFKDILVQKKTLLFALGYCFFLVFAFQSLEGTTPVAVTTAVVYILIANSFAYEEKNKTETMLNSLPIPRRNIVLAKYLSIFVYIGLAVLAYMIATLVVSSLKIPVKVSFIGIQEITITSMTISLMASLYLPIIFKFGYLKSKFFNMIVFLFFLFIPMLLTSLYKNPQYAPLIDNVIKEFATWSDWQIVLLLAGIALLILSLSYYISVSIYKNREF